ncbi:hypothetical protein P152DRAFT_448134 [Eremomyces bilateralis CBS 781.70]|uniref:Uncharacterized protein n=1 Tax=Eremomyces bilateralis CBS 781.70 TaxID=1392243 RepID=A0A6G1G6S5_9PEZI|nr:uncharacterized protein P152DRAFT_448134 [Eremomyces bilateralis CBS 781.70]KAF1813722.1 hypothetical protein P152DRAFT_448134 [Eremomyces bilateralis CBS 781.70]
MLHKMIFHPAPKKVEAPVISIQPETAKKVEERPKDLFQLDTEMADSPRVPSVAECAAHLKLLNAFIVLKASFEAWGQEAGVPSESCWQQYMALATARFSTWLRYVRESGEISQVPSLDILLVWHAFMLNPADYFKTCGPVIGETRETIRVAGIPWEALRSCIDPVSGKFNLSASQEEILNSLNLHVDPLKFLEEENKADAAKSHFMAIMKKPDVQAEKPEHAGADTEKVVVDVKQNLLLGAYDLMAEANFTFKSIEFDPIAAVTRQLGFTEKMAHFGWLHSPTLDSTLRFADTAGAAPTMDIDPVWHTHQVSPSRYLAYCKETHGPLINHDDRAETPKLEEGFEKAQEAYKSATGAAYLECNSWYCEHDRAGGKKGLLAKDQSLLDHLIDAENQRRRNANVPVLLDFAQCCCHCSHPAQVDAESAERSKASSSQTPLDWPRCRRYRSVEEGVGKCHRRCGTFEEGVGACKRVGCPKFYEKDVGKCHARCRASEGGMGRSGGSTAIRRETCKLGPAEGIKSSAVIRCKAWRMSTAEGSKSRAANRSDVN